MSIYPQIQKVLNALCSHKISKYDAYVLICKLFLEALKDEDELEALKGSIACGCLWATEDDNIGEVLKEVKTDELGTP